MRGTFKDFLYDYCYRKKTINTFGIIISLALGLHKSQYCPERSVLFCKYRFFFLVGGGGGVTFVNVGVVEAFTLGVFHNHNPSNQDYSDQQIRL